MKTAKEFYEYFERIPEANWCTGTYIKPSPHQETIQCCALGHLGCSEDLLRPDSADALEDLFAGSPNPSTGVAEINDGLDPDYQQSTPKQRILAALQAAAEYGK
jgi:hypothetical protein